MKNLISNIIYKNHLPAYLNRKYFMNQYLNKSNGKISRRDFLFTVAAGSSMTGFSPAGGIRTVMNSEHNKINRKKNMKKITIQSVDSNFEREPLIKPFGFKGGYITEIWQTAAR